MRKMRRLVGVGMEEFRSITKRPHCGLYLNFSRVKCALPPLPGVKVKVI
jgi:hypothetical protein